MGHLEAVIFRLAHWPVCYGTVFTIFDMIDFVGKHIGSKRHHQCKQDNDAAEKLKLVSTHQIGGNHRNKCQIGEKECIVKIPNRKK